MKEQNIVDTPVLTFALKMHFTSCSPDAKPISIALISDPQFDALSRRDDHINGSDPAIFYAQFNDFIETPYDMFVNDNVIPNLFTDIKSHTCSVPDINQFMTGCVSEIQSALVVWLNQFSDYRIEFAVDCGHLVWSEFLKLIATWKTVSHKNQTYKIGLPQLPDNFSHIPTELNTVIAQQEIMDTSEEAFNEDRIEYVNEIIKVDTDKYEVYGSQHNALFDAFIIQTMLQWYMTP